ncbi:hypothetical protein PFISCL1PPCAC_20413 [Pristionchus fissidentatus]|uniref:Mitochondrial carrier protein n=1 Tax=Pristionchus fissidentatus TaxID=1538716 RepID=A0AAV5WA41_9BILA|nr:hypothetical protein PFISCL1PPCAC_20413 [Pristionchus fissidentatus]
MASSDTDFDIDRQQKLHIIQWEHLDLYKFYPMAIASSWSIRCFLYPMSVVKSRLQLQRQNNMYKGMRHAFVDIVKKEGIGALYRGFWMTLPQLSASFLYSSVYESSRDMFQTKMGIKSSAVVSALAGGLASPAAQFVFVPTDIIAQHMMVHKQHAAFSGGKRNQGIVEALAKDGLEGKRTLGLRVAQAIYRVDGIKGFYRGFLSAIMLYIPSTMVFWSTYYNMQELLESARNKAKNSGEDGGDEGLAARRLLFVDQAISGTVGGVASAICTNPLEMLRIRLQVHRTSYRETVRRLIKYEGMRVFTQGLAPRVVNNALYSCLVMLGYETVKKMCVLPEYKDCVIW